MILIACIIGWLVCGIVSAGMYLADIQGRFPEFAECDYRYDLAAGLAIGLIGGPIALLAMFFGSGFCKHGWRLK